MKKDFDKWNVNKKLIHENTENRYYHERDIWWCSLGANVGFEEDGKGSDYQRPVLIIKGFSRQVCLVVPLTSSSKENPYHISVGNIQDHSSCAIISQIRLIDTKRLVNQIGFVDEKLFETIKKAIKDFL